MSEYKIKYIHEHDTWNEIVIQFKLLRCWFGWHEVKYFKSYVPPKYICFSCSREFIKENWRDDL